MAFNPYYCLGTVDPEMAISFISNRIKLKIPIAAVVIITRESIVVLAGKRGGKKVVRGCV
jgi:hypothetical protein